MCGKLHSIPCSDSDLVVLRHAIAAMEKDAGKHSNLDGEFSVLPSRPYGCAEALFIEFIHTLIVLDGLCSKLMKALLPMQ